MAKIRTSERLREIESLRRQSMSWAIRRELEGDIIKRDNSPLAEAADVTIRKPIGYRLAKGYAILLEKWEDM